MLLFVLDQHMTFNLNIRTVSSNKKLELKMQDPSHKKKKKKQHVLRIPKEYALAVGKPNIHQQPS